MRVKKLLALLLSGAFFAGCLSGCDRTIIEHQFHTNTETVVETEVITEFIDYTEEFRNLEKLLNDHGIALTIAVNNTLLGEDDYFGFSDDLSADDKITQDELDSWLENSLHPYFGNGQDGNGNQLDLVNKVEPKELTPGGYKYDSSQLLKITLEHLHKYYEVFNAMTPTQWDELNGVSILSITSQQCTDGDGDGDLFVKTIIGH